MFDDDDFVPLFPIPTRQEQRVGDWWEKREEYRQQALVSLRRREGLPTSERCLGAFYQRSDGAFYRTPPGREVSLDTTLYPNGKGGFTSQAIGQIQGEPRDSASQHWNRDSRFQILEVSEDGSRTLADELSDLHRDSLAYSHAERVSHGSASQQAPGLELAGLGDGEVDARLQQYLKKDGQQ